MAELKFKDMTTDVRIVYYPVIHEVGYCVAYGIDPVVGWYLDVYDDPYLDPIISYSQFTSFDPYENFEGVYSRQIVMVATGFNGKLLALLLMQFKLPREFWYHVGQMKKNSEPPIRSRGYLSAGRDIPIHPSQDDKEYVVMVDPNF